jgi:hypothetical protein
VDHAADTAGLKFDGILAESDRVQVFSTDTAGRPVKLERPWRFVMAIAAAAAGDEGKAVFVVDNQTVGYTSQNTVFVGWVDQVLSTTLVLIRPFWAGTDPTQVVPSTLANFRNLIDGGDMTTNPAQRGTSQAADIANVLTYGPDRFAFKGGASSTINWSIVTDTNVAGFSKSLKWQRKSGNADVAAFNLIQVVETADAVRTQGQNVVVSFWARTGANYSGGNLTVKVITGTGTDDTANNALAGSWAGQANVVNSTQALTSTMTRYSFSGAVPAGCKQLAVQLQWTPAGTAGADDSVILNGVQLEVGSAETTFEHRDVQVELEICQRYFWQINEPAASVVLGIGQCTTTTLATIQINLPVQMRTAPSVSVTKGSIGVTVAAGTNQGLTTLAAAAAGHTVNAIGLTATASAANLVAGNATQLIGNAGVGLVAASADY